MPNLQNWLNAWVKVNAKHQATPSSEAGGSNNKGRQHPADPRHKHIHHDSSLRTATESSLSTNSNRGTSPASTADPELVAIRKFNNRKHKRRLHRTNSFSDLIREKAKQRDSKNSGTHNSQKRHNSLSTATNNNNNNQQHRLTPQHRQRAPHSLHDKGTAPTAHPPSVSLLEGSSPTGTVQTVHHSNLRANQHAEQYQYQEQYPSHDHEETESVEDPSSSTHTSHSVLWGVADFFGADISSSEYHTDHRQQQQPDLQNGRGRQKPNYLSTHIRPQHLQQEEEQSHYQSKIRQQKQQSSNDNKAIHEARSTNPSPRGLQSKQEKNSHSKPTETGILVGGVRLPFFSTASTTSADNRHQTNGDNSNDNNKNPFGGKPGCAGCKVAEAELQHAQESLEYMRGMAIRKEYCCPKCGADSSQNKPTTLSVVKTASQQQVEVTARHKKQVEQLMKERNHWQRNMHLKLEKFANLCRNMNNESSLQSERAQALQEELENTRRERDEMAGELDKLRADVLVYEKERAENRQLQQIIQDYETRGLDQAEEAITLRDGMIAKLSARLETTLNTLAVEREQQRQRRQIIFPPSVRNGSHHHHAQNNKNAMNGGSHPPYKTCNNENDATHSPGGATNNANVTQQNGNFSESSEDEVKRLREQLLESQRRLESTQLEAKQRETALMFKCETLEARLNRATGSSQKDISPALNEHQQSIESDDECD